MSLFVVVYFCVLLAFGHLVTNKNALLRTNISPSSSLQYIHIIDVYKIHGMLSSSVVS